MPPPTTEAFMPPVIVWLNLPEVVLVWPAEGMLSTARVPPLFRAVPLICYPSKPPALRLLPIEAEVLKAAPV